MLLLTAARTGAGHVVVGEALAEAVKARPGRFAMDVLDVLAPAQPRWTDHLAHLYEPTIVHVPWLWSAIYAATNSPLCPLIYHALAGQSLVRRVVAAAEAQPPDVMVSVHPRMVRAAVAARRQSSFLADKPIVTVVTDLVDIHRVWVAAGVDHYVAGSEAAAATLMRYGVAPQRIARLGIPLRPEYGRRPVPTTPPDPHDPTESEETKPASQTEMRRRLDLDPQLPLVLFMGGGAGAGSLVKRVRAVAALAQQTGREFQIAVVTGSNVRSRNALEGIAWPLPVQVYGYVPSTADLMTAADIVATKPGSVTVSEALAVGRPLVLSRPAGGQEAGNIPYVVQGQAGFYAPNPQETADASALLLQQPDICWEMGQHAARLGAPDATRRTLDLIQGLVARPSPP
ncbi:MAG: glycosyltransferase [Chloroflexota bacterium]|nr:glycosyltransferase [Chloroflexota bacterium]